MCLDDAHAAVVRQALTQARRLIDLLPQVRLPHLQTSRFPIVEEVAHESAQAGHFALQNGQVLTEWLGMAVPGFEGVEGRGDAEQRIADLVSHTCEEGAHGRHPLLAPHALLQLDQARDVARHDDDPFRLWALIVGYDVSGHLPSPRSELVARLRRGRRPSLQRQLRHAPDGPPWFTFAEVPRLLAHHILVLQFCYFAAGAVEPKGTPVTVEDENRRIDRLERTPPLFRRPSKRRFRFAQRRAGVPALGSRALRRRVQGTHRRPGARRYVRHAPWRPAQRAWRPSGRRRWRRRPSQV